MAFVEIEPKCGGGSSCKHLIFLCFLFLGEGSGRVPSLSVEVGVEKRFNVGKKIRSNTFSCISSERNAHKTFEYFAQMLFMDTSQVRNDIVGPMAYVSA